MNLPTQKSGSTRLHKGLVLITKDEDFFQRACRPSAQVQIVWVRLGNCRKAALLAAFESVMPQLETALQQGQRVVEIRCP